MPCAPRHQTYNPGDTRARRSQVIDPETPGSEEERWLITTVRTLVQNAGIPMPEVGIYDSREVNAFVIFLSRVVGFVIDSALSKGKDGERRGTGLG